MLQFVRMTDNLAKIVILFGDILFFYCLQQNIQVIDTIYFLYKAKQY